MLSRIAILAMAALVCAAQPVNSSETISVTLDGVWWMSLTPDEKVRAMQGMIVGFAAGYERGEINEYNETRPRGDPQLPKGLSPVDPAEPTFADRTFGTMVSKMDAVFEGHPKLAKTLVQNFVECAGESGKDCESVALDVEKSAHR